MERFKMGSGSHGLGEVLAINLFIAFSNEVDFMVCHIAGFFSFATTYKPPLKDLLPMRDGGVRDYMVDVMVVEAGEFVLCTSNPFSTIGTGEGFAP